MHAATVSISEENNHLDTPEARHHLRSQVGFFLSFSSPRILVLNALALLAARLTLGLDPGRSVLVDVVAFVGVCVLWPTQEWVLHRWALHRKPTRWRGFVIDPVFARKHREHHRQPWIVETTMLPVRLLVVLVPLQALWLLVPDVRLALTLAATYATWAVLYEWTHYLAHANWVPRSSYWRRIWKNHRLHHFKNEHHWFAFTVPYVDSWLGTDPADKDVEKSATVRTLGVDDAH